MRKRIGKEAGSVKSTKDSCLFAQIVAVVLIVIGVILHVPGGNVDTFIDNSNDAKGRSATAFYKEMGAYNTFFDYDSVIDYDYYDAYDVREIANIIADIAIGKTVLSARITGMIAAKSIFVVGGVILFCIATMKKHVMLDKKAREIMNVAYEYMTAEAEKERENQSVKEDLPQEEAEPEQTGSDVQGFTTFDASEEQNLSPSYPPEEDEFDDYDAFLDECEREEREQLNRKKKTHG